MTVSLGKLVTRNLGHINLGSRCSMGEACQNTPIPERESEENERKTGRKSTKSEGKELGSKAGKERKKESGGQREGRKSGQKREYIRHGTV